MFSHGFTSLHYMNPICKPYFGINRHHWLDSILYPIGCSFVLDIIGIVYCTLFGLKNYVASFVNYIFSSITFSSSFCCMATWSNCFNKLWVTIWFMFVTILPLFLGIFFCHKFKSLQQIYSKLIPNKISSPIMTL